MYRHRWAGDGAAFERAKADYLEWLAETGRMGGSSSSTFFFAERRIPMSVAHAIVAQVAGDGTAVEFGSSSSVMPHDVCVMANAAYFMWLTSTGHDVVSARRQRREDVVLRRDAVQSALLEWLCARDRQGERWARRPDFLGSRYDYFEGERFQPDDVEHGIECLEHGGLVLTVRRLLLKVNA
jgi:hypothetical protein